MNENIHGIPATTDYKSYLLRMWRSDSNNSSDWHVSMEDARTGERFGFANLEELFAFLLQVRGEMHADSED